MQAEFEDIQLTGAGATAILRWAAAQETAPGGAHEAAIREIRNLTAAPDGRIALAEILAVISNHVPEPGTCIHARRQAPGSTAIVGTYWALDDAIAMAREPGTACAWTCGAYFHDLRVTADDGVTVWFHAFCPERCAVSRPARKERLLAEIAGYRNAGQCEDAL